MPLSCDATEVILRRDGPSGALPLPWPRPAPRPAQTSAWGWPPAHHPARLQLANTRLTIRKALPTCSMHEGAAAGSDPAAISATSLPAMAEVQQVLCMDPAYQLQIFYTWLVCQGRVACGGNGVPKAPQVHLTTSGACKVWACSVTEDMALVM